MRTGHLQLKAAPPTITEPAPQLTSSAERSTFARSVGVRAEWFRAHLPALSASLAMAFGFAWLLRVGALPIVPPREAWMAVRPIAVAAYVAAFVLGHLMRCARWTLLVNRRSRPPLGLSTWIGLVSYGAIVLLPFRLGEAVRPLLLRSRGGLPLGTSAGVVGAERVLDGLFVSSMLLVALLRTTFVTPLPDHIGQLPVPVSMIPGIAWAGVCVFGVLSLAMLIFYRWQAPLCGLAERYIGRLSASLASRVVQSMKSVAHGFRFLEDLESGRPFAFVTVCYWILNVGSIGLLIWAAGLPWPTAGQASIVLGVMGLGLVVPNAPGYFGTFQISTYSALALFFPLHIVTRAGAAFVFLLYTVQMSVILLGAGAALVWGSRALTLPASPRLPMH